MIDFAPHTDQELKELAIDIFEGKVFTDRHIPEEEERGLLMVFMPLALGAGKDWTEDDYKSIGMFYEYMDQAGPRVDQWNAVVLLHAHDKRRAMRKGDPLSRRISKIERRISEQNLKP